MTPEPIPPALPLDHLALRGADGAPALLVRGDAVPYRELRTRVGQIAGWLSARVGEPGARVAAWLPKSELACLLQLAALKIPNLRIAGKTGTAQVRTPKGTLNLAWFVCFAPVERPEIAIAVMVEGDTTDETYAGGRYAAPVAQAILKKWKEKKDRPPGFIPPKT